MRAHVFGECRLARPGQNLQPRLWPGLCQFPWAAQRAGRVKAAVDQGAGIMGHPVDLPQHLIRIKPRPVDKVMGDDTGKAQSKSGIAEPRTRTRGSRRRKSRIPRHTTHPPPPVRWPGCAAARRFPYCATSGRCPSPASSMTHPPHLMKKARPNRARLIILHRLPAGGQILSKDLEQTLCQSLPRRQAISFCRPWPLRRQSLPFPP